MPQLGTGVAYSRTQAKHVMLHACDSQAAYTSFHSKHEDLRYEQYGDPRFEISGMNSLRTPGLKTQVLNVRETQGPEIQELGTQVRNRVRDTPLWW